MDDPLLVRVLDRPADGHEQRQPLAGREVAVVAELGDRHAVDQLHDEVGPAGVGGAGVEDAGDVLVVHHGQGLALGLEAGDDLAAVHPRLDDLQRDAAADGLGLLGHVDDAHAALADLLEQLVGADAGARSLGDRPGAGPVLDRAGGGIGGRRNGRPRVAGGGIEEVARLRVGAQQGLDAAAELGVAAAGAVQEGGALGRGRSSPGRIRRSSLHSWPVLSHVIDVDANGSLPRAATVGERECPRGYSGSGVASQTRILRSLVAPIRRRPSETNRIDTQSAWFVPLQDLLTRAQVPDSDRLVELAVARRSPSGAEVGVVHHERVTLERPDLAGGLGVQDPHLAGLQGTDVAPRQPGASRPG